MKSTDLSLHFFGRFCLALILLAIVLASFFLRDPLARTFWHHLGKPDLALIFVKSDAELAMELGDYYFNNGAYDLAKAEAAFKKAVTVNPHILWGHYQIARIEFVRGNFNEALNEINKELDANPENLRSLYVRGLIYGYRGDLGKAEDDFRNFVNWAPKEWAGYNDLAWILSKEGRPREVIAEVNRAFKEIPEGIRNPWLWNMRGVAELNLNQYQEASRSFREASKLAAEVTAEDWGKAYPGNDPENSILSLLTFQKAIADNLKRTESLVNKPVF